MVLGTLSLLVRSRAEDRSSRGPGTAERLVSRTVNSQFHRLTAFSSAKGGEAGRSRENVHNTCERDAPIEVEFSFVNRVIVRRNSGSSDSPSVLMIPGAFRGSV